MLLAAAIAVFAAQVTVTTSASAHTMGDGSTMNDDHRGPGAVVDLIRAAFASAPFLRFDNAAGGGYIGKVADKAGITCITDLNVPSTGAMGVHFVNPGLIDLNDDPTVNDTIDAGKPEVLVYEPDAAGHYNSSRSSTSSCRRNGMPHTPARRPCSGMSSCPPTRPIGSACRPITHFTRGSGSSTRAARSRCGTRTCTVPEQLTWRATRGRNPRAPSARYRRFVTQMKGTALMPAVDAPETAAPQRLRPTMYGMRARRNAVSGPACAAANAASKASPAALAMPSAYCAANSMLP